MLEAPRKPHARQFDRRRRRRISPNLSELVNHAPKAAASVFFHSLLAAFSRGFNHSIYLPLPEEIQRAGSIKQSVRCDNPLPGVARVAEDSD
jgi:hypothetical protein